MDPKNAIQKVFSTFQPFHRLLAKCHIGVAIKEVAGGLCLQSELEAAKEVVVVELQKSLSTQSQRVGLTQASIHQSHN